MKNTLAIMKNRAKLERMISNNETYDRILEQSQKLDKYINVAMEEKNYTDKNLLKNRKDSI